MKHFDRFWLLENAAHEMRRRAWTGTWDGIRRWPMRYFDDCTAIHEATGTKLIFTRDVKMHSGGWLKNPDYERCLHLSLSFYDPQNLRKRAHAPRDVKLSKKWIEAIFGEAQRYLWAESPKTEDGKRIEVWHYRVFTDEAWQPIIPRKEMYTREFTERGWLSFSDLKWEAEEEYQEAMERGGYAL